MAIRIFYYIALVFLTIPSWGFVDANMPLPKIAALQPLIFFKTIYPTVWYIASVVFLFGFYLWALYSIRRKALTSKDIWYLIFGTAAIFFWSFPALSNDIFNYIATAKVAFVWKENPYIVMPIEIPNEPYLAFTRAANKVALYGPVWILLTAIPHFLGNNNIWQTIIMFKVMNVLCYVAFSYLIYRTTNSIKNVVFFVFNPLVLIETLVSGHNDIYMILLACCGLILWQRCKLLGALSLFASALIKGATVVLLPLVLIKNISWNTLLRYAYILLSIVFFVVAPLREELYPWYAVWLIGVASLMDMKKNWLIISFTIVLSFSLELRHLPYMWMGYYEGLGPFLRTLLTLVPIGMYISSIGIRYVLKKQHEKI